MSSKAKILISLAMSLIMVLSIFSVSVFASDDYDEEYEFMYGDVNGDGKVNATDALLILKFKVESFDLDDDQLLAADVDGNGEVDSVDALLILKYNVKIILQFPIEVEEILAMYMGALEFHSNEAFEDGNDIPGFDMERRIDWLNYKFTYPESDQEFEEDDEFETDFTTYLKNDDEQTIYMQPSMCTLEALDIIKFASCVYDEDSDNYTIKFEFNNEIDPTDEDSELLKIFGEFMATNDFFDEFISFSQQYYDCYITAVIDGETGKFITLEYFLCRDVEWEDMYVEYDEDDEIIFEELYTAEGTDKMSVKYSNFVF